MDTTAMLGIGSLVVAIATAIWGIRQTFVTNRLTQEVHRLSVRLDQSLQRLERARELIGNIHAVSEDIANTIFVEDEGDTSDLIKALTVTKTSQVELIALAKVIDDKEFLDMVQDLKSVLESIERPGTPERWLEWSRRIEPHFENLHERVYRLLEDATREQEH